MTSAYSLEIDVDPNSECTAEGFFDKLCLECNLDRSSNHEPAECFHSRIWTVKLECSDQYKEKRNIVGDLISNLVQEQKVLYATW